MKFTRRRFCFSLAAGTAAAAFTGRAGGLAGFPPLAAGDGSVLARPTPRQAAWQDLELGMFIHFDMATFTGKTKPRISADPDV